MAQLTALLVRTAAGVALVAATAAFCLFLAAAPELRAASTGAASMLAPAVLIDLWLVSLLAIQHAAMTSPAFRQDLDLPADWHQPLQRGLAALCLSAMIYVWQAVPIPAWRIADPLLWIGFRACQAVAGALLLGAVFWEMILPWFPLGRLAQQLPRIQAIALVLSLWITPEANQGRLLLAVALSAALLATLAVRSVQKLGACPTPGETAWMSRWIPDHAPSADVPSWRRLYWIWTWTGPARYGRSRL